MAKIKEIPRDQRARITRQLRDKHKPDNVIKIMEDHEILSLAKLFRW